MTVDDFLKQPGAWLGTAEDSGIVVSSRLRLARNLKEAAFPGWAGEQECDRIWKELQPVLQALTRMAPGFAAGMSDLDELDRQVLFERHLISREQSEKGRGSGLVASADETQAIMVNEEDHLRMQVITAGLNLKETWARIDELDSQIEKSFAYAFSARLGYLTACPTNVGTGMRASVMLHVPGLVLMNQINPIVKGVSKIGLAVRGLWGEGTEAVGNMFQISNQISLGEKEENIIANLEQIVLEIVNHEKNARAQLMEKREAILRDHVGRAYGILANAHILSSKEALDLLSGLNLGIELGILNKVDRKVINELLLMTQPGHLQKAEGKKLKPKDRDRARADLIRTRLAAVSGKNGLKK
ncbi:MAG: protein arginine kinase [Verrucomicrobiota bacterium]